MTPAEIRARLIADLQRLTGHRDPIALMNALQNRALVSDNAVTLDHVPADDLNRAVRSLQR